jgi:hypothetical protein
MAVIEQERKTTDEHAPERAIFVAADGRRARRLRRAAFVAAFLACLWVVGLGVGMLGFGSLPGVSVVKQQVDEITGGSPDEPRAERKDLRRTVRRSSLLESRVVANARQSAAVQSQARAGSRPTASRPVSRPPAAQVTPPVAQQPVNPAQRTRGWARDGQTAPPGQARRITPPPPPGTRGQHRGQTLPTTPPPVPPGQVKKALPPPPPPPPPIPPPKKA